MNARVIGWICCALGMAGAGSVVVASKLAGAGLPVFVAAAARYGLAALALVPWALARGEPLWRGGRDGMLLAAQAAAGSLGFSVLMLAGLRLAGGADAAVIAGTLPAMVALLSLLLPGGMHPGRKGWAAVGLAGLGTASLGLGGMDGTGDGHWTGTLLLLGAMAGEAAFVLLNRALRAPLPPVGLSAAMCLGGFVLTLPPALAELGGLDAATVPWSAWAAVLWHALVPTILGFVLWYAGAARLGGAEAAVATALMPLAAALLSRLVLDERLGGHHLLGIALVLAAILVPLIPPGYPR
jgi:drug/metabolite transporter (DMT)-like permease